MKNLAKDLGYNNSFVVPARGSSGGAAFFWNDRVKIHFLDNPNLYCTNMTVEDESNIFWLSYVYGNPIRKFRQLQWQ